MLDDKDKAGLIVLSFVIIIVSGILLNYLANPYWIGTFIVLIITFGFIGLWLYILSLFEYIQAKIKNKNIENLERELERLRK